MLVRLFGKNFRSFRGDFELSMVAADLPKEKDRGVVEVKINGQDEPLRLLRCAAIYGANASGKTTVLLAAKALHWLISKSSQQSKPGKPITPYDPFVLDPNTVDAPVQLGCTIASNGSLYEYEIEYLKKTIEHESLKQIAEDVTILFERNIGNEVTGSLIEKSKANALYVQDIQPNVAVLSKLAQHGPAKGKESIVAYYKAILSSLVTKDYAQSTQPEQPLANPIAKKFKENDDFLQWVMTNLIQPADMGIVGVKITTLDLPGNILKRLTEISKSSLPQKTDVIQFVHKGGDNQVFDFINEAAGTRKLYNLSEDWWKLAHKETTLFADEISASLHPRLLDVLVRAINAPQEKETKSQIILTTHDVGLLEGRDGKPPALRRDQVYFTEKENDGGTKLYSLTEFKDDARAVHNIRKRYLSGRYGALPMPEGISL